MRISSRIEAFSVIVKENFAEGSLRALLYRMITYYTLVTDSCLAHLNWRLLVPRSLDRSPTLSTLELLSSLMLWPVFRLLVLLHRRFQD